MRLQLSLVAVISSMATAGPVPDAQFRAPSFLGRGITMKTVSKNGARDNIPYQDLPLWNTGDNTLNQPNPTDNQLIPNSDNSNPGANSNEDIVAWATGPSLSPFGVPQNLSPAGYPFDQGLDFYNNYRCDAHMSICCSGNAVTSTNIKTKSCEQRKEVLGAGKEFLFWGDRRAATYCHAPIFMDHCEDVNDPKRAYLCYSDCPAETGSPTMPANQQ